MAFGFWGFGEGNLKIFKIMIQNLKIEILGGTDYKSLNPFSCFY